MSLAGWQGAPMWRPWWEPTGEYRGPRKTMLSGIRDGTVLITVLVLVPLVLWLHPRRWDICPGPLTNSMTTQSRDADLATQRFWRDVKRCRLSLSQRCLTMADGNHKHHHKQDINKSWIHIIKLVDLFTWFHKNQELCVSFGLWSNN